ncbi:uncharacterized protein EV420DRAFT_1636623 [Desarmillaria tabescens]|uniref:polynucleotide adenylyltransferase n=1 Tax=Armillaria tabescens TaxID=1929756 RepID=A0AA39NIA1_ARMTA|nr:uncharacterized protein EV420DRAFT_1636623 [Desarmillaria tabescens]KAK0466039.1 hypothetical protein EV420DRAFT_1636623 [Desarmillaria tabescens]
MSSSAPNIPESVCTPWMALIKPTTFRDLDHRRDYISRFFLTLMSNRLHEEIIAYSTYAGTTFEEVHIREKVFRFIENAVRGTIPGSRVGVFGSVVTGLTLPVPDLDLAIVAERMTTKRDIKRQLFRLRDQFQRGRLIDDAQVRVHAKVPIVRFTTRPEFGSISVDIGVNNIDGIHVAEMIKEYLAKMPQLRPLVLVTKGLLSRSGFNDPAHGGLGSYAVVCMCISFLQINPPSESLGKLLADMLYYYGVSFSYETSYISVREGQVLPKSSAAWCGTGDKLVIQCLKNPEKNIASSVDRTARLREIFKEAYTKLLKATVQDPVVLGTIVGYPRSVLDHRAAIKSLVNVRSSAIGRSGRNRRDSRDDSNYRGGPSRRRDSHDERYNNRDFQPRSNGGRTYGSQRNRKAERPRDPASQMSKD